MGEVRELNPGDWLYPHVQVRSYMLVEAGLTGRIVATVDGQSGAGAMALSTPMPVSYTHLTLPTNSLV